MKHRFLTIILALLLLCAILPAQAWSYGDYAVVSGTSALNLRSGPGTNYQWLGSAKEGEWVTILGESGNWYRVIVVNSGLSGFMSKNYLITSAEKGTTGVVNNPVSTQFLNLRMYPSYSAPVITYFYNGATFQVLSVADGWVNVKMDSSGLEGYFRQEYVKLYSGSSTAMICTENGGKLNLRSTPSYSGSSIIGQYQNGSSVSVLLKGNTFWKVSVNGQVGFMDSAFLREGYTPAPVPGPVPGPVPVTSGYAIVNNPKATQVLSLRSQPSTSAKVVAQYKNGIRMEIIQPGETWCKVYGKSSGNIGYMMTKYLRLYGVSPSPTKVVQNGSSYVNLRSSPSKQTGVIYQQVYSGAVVTVLTPGDEWSQVRYGSTVGYMMTAFLK